MSDMNEEQLKKALGHDRARKGNGEQTFRVETHDGEVVDVEPRDLLADLDVQQAAIAKGLAIIFTEVARKCAALVLVGLDGNTEERPLMEIAEKALKLADLCGMLGDKAEARTPE